VLQATRELLVDYVSYYAGPHWKDSCLLQVAQQVSRLELQQFDWYSDGYDKGYQGIIGVVEVPNDDLLIISVQRDSHPVLYDPRARKKVGTLELCNRRGNPDLFFRRRVNELWANSLLTLMSSCARSLAHFREMSLAWTRPPFKVDISVL